MRSHFLHMLLYSSIVSVFLALLFRDEARARVRFAAMLWVVMCGAALAFAYLMYPFPT
jgi:hypothetical protein